MMFMFLLWAGFAFIPVLLFMSGFAFVNLDVSYFNPGTWPPPARFVTFAWCFVVTPLTCLKMSKWLHFPT